MKLRSRFLIIVSAFTIICVISLSTGLTHELYKFWRGQAETKLIEGKNSILAYINQTIDTANATAMFIRDDELTARYFDLSEQDRYFLLYPAISRYLNSFLDIYPFIQEISLLVDEGYEEVRASRNIDNNQEYSDSPAFRTLWLGDEERIEAVEYNEESASYVLNIYQSIKLADRSKSAREKVVKSIVRISIDLEYIKENTDNYLIWSNSLVAIYETSGQVVMSDGTELSAVLIGEHIQGESSLAIYGNEEFLLGSDKIFGEWSVFVAIPLKENLSMIREITQKSGLILLAFFSVLGLIVYFALKLFIIDPIGELNKAIDRFSSQGKVTQFNHRKDEIGLLQSKFSAMSEKIRLQNTYLKEQAYTDVLTGLPNRNILNDILISVIKNAEVKQRKVGLLFLDLDGFKQVNDVLGHAAGDALLQKVAERLNAMLRAGDILSRFDTKNYAEEETLLRIGGDEFTVILPNVRSKIDLEKICGRLLEQFQIPFRIMGRDVYVGTSIGVSMFPDDSRSSKDLMKYADTAMYVAKSEGKMRYSFFRHSMFDATETRLQLENALHNAKFTEEFWVAYQPKVNLNEKIVVGFETLARLETDKLGFVSPTQFIPLAEEIGLLNELTVNVVESACDTIAVLEEEFGRQFTMAINISPRQLTDEHLFDEIYQTLLSRHIDPALIEFEVTENSLIDNEEAAEHIFATLKERGFHTALDDFGVGYSSLSHLKRFRFDTLKIDRIFFRDIENDKCGEAILISMIQLAKQLDMVIVAEGIETTQQLRFVNEHDVDLVQGYFFSKPVAADILAETVERVEQESRLAGLSDNVNTV